MKVLKRPRIIVILGPTASGKSALAIALARKLGGEIISADSRQVYRGLNIGTGKVTKNEMRGVPHYLLDVASPRAVFTVARYQTLARRAIREILRHGHVPIICGGTGLYIDALLYDYNLPRVKPNIKLRRTLQKKTTAELFAQLQKLDPARALAIDQHNPRRLIRALEIVQTTGKPVPPLPLYIYSHILENIGIDKHAVLKIGIHLSETELKRRIHARFQYWLKQGLLSEIKKLRSDGVGWKRFDTFGLEYKQASHYLRGFISRKEMIQQSEKELWRYAKRQMAWFKRDKEIQWIRNEREAERLIRSTVL